MTSCVWLVANEQLDMTLNAKMLRLEDDDNPMLLVDMPFGRKGFMCHY